MCFPQLGLKIDYKPGGCAIFRGSELEHFVEDWVGYRIFVACTIHQPVRNWAHRKLGKLPALPSDPWFTGTEENDVASTAQGTATGADENYSYEPCVETDMDMEEDPEGSEWLNSLVHGPGTWSSSSSYSTDK